LRPLYAPIVTKEQTAALEKLKIRMEYCSQWLFWIKILFSHEDRCFTAGKQLLEHQTNIPKMRSAGRKTSDLYCDNGLHLTTDYFSPTITPQLDL
jgi:hypothetical protein